MERNNFLVRRVVVAVTVAAIAFASPLTRPEVNDPIRATLNGSIVNAPLTDWIKNTDTDLQWYTTILVGTPPQTLYVILIQAHFQDPT